jgi:hypothetical protein
MNVTVGSLNNKLKKYIHVPQCNTANMVFQKCKVAEQFEDTVGGGVKSPEGLDISALSGLERGSRKPIVRNLPPNNETSGGRHQVCQTRNRKDDKAIEKAERNKRSHG